MKNNTNRSFAFYKPVSLILVGICVLVLGCKDSVVIWAAESRSPDGRWVVSASTEQFGGPGNAYVGTTAYLRAVNSSKPSLLVLGLSNDSAYPAGMTNLGMNWISSSHLELTYKGHVTIDFQAVRCEGIEISLRDLSSETEKIPQ